MRSALLAGSFSGRSACQNTVSFSPVFGEVITDTPFCGTSESINDTRRASFRDSKYDSLDSPTLTKGVTTADVDHLMRCQPASSLHTIILKNGYSMFGRSLSTPERQLQAGLHFDRPASEPGLASASRLMSAPSPGFRFLRMLVEADGPSARIQRVPPQPAPFERFHLPADRLGLLAHVIRHGRRHALELLVDGGRNDATRTRAGPER